MLDRYSKYKIAGVWCANAPLARAYADLLKTRGKKPGVDFVTAGTDWDPESVESVKRGDLLGVAGGHVASAAWILTLIHDYHNGIDFDSSVYLSKVTVMNRDTSGKFLKHFKGGNWDIIDFSRFSKAENKHIKEYDHSFKAIFDSLK